MEQAAILVKKAQNILDYEIIFNDKGELVLENLLKIYSVSMPILTLLRIIYDPNSKNVVYELLQIALNE